VSWVKPEVTGISAEYGDWVMVGNWFFAKKCCMVMEMCQCIAMEQGPAVCSFLQSFPVIDVAKIFQKLCRILVLQGAIQGVQFTILEWHCKKKAHDPFLTFWRNIAPPSSG
jgi:hypothetical protein